MKKTIKLFAQSAMVCVLLNACSSDDMVQVPYVGGFSIDNRPVYLRGEMNDYEVSETYRLRKSGNAYCTLSTLRADWAPYKFKFADSEWTDGSNFGYMMPPGTLRDDSKMVELNSSSKFEELVFYPESDGIYRFCLVSKDGGYYAYVQKTSKRSLLSMAQLIKISKNDD